MTEFRTKLDQFKIWFFRGNFLPGWVYFVLPFLFIGFIIFFIIFFGLTFTWPFVVAQLWHFVEMHNKSYWFLISGVALVICFGVLMYFLREYVRFAYGLVEISGATVLAWIALAEPHNSGVVFATALMGSIYIFVRGIDNIRQYARDQAKWEHAFTSPVSHADALDKGIAEFLRKEASDNTADYRDYNTETVSFIVLAQEVLVDKQKVTNFRVRVDQKWISYPKPRT
jgi:hypothetical protein